MGYVLKAVLSSAQHPEYGQIIDDEDGIEQADEFAKRLAQIEREWPESDMVKYKALLSVVDHPSLQDATRLMGEIDQYELRPEVAQTWGYAEMMFREKYSALPEELFQTPQAAQIGQKMLDDRLGVTQGKSYRGNIEGSDPRCSFHWVGTSDRLYVFEAPIDLLAFLTLYPDGWQQHSYVALCGTAEHAMLWMLEKNPNLRKAILCLDHDAAGIEAAGRLSDILREHGYSQIASLQSEHKDWDEDLKAWNGLEAQPAEEHPQFAVAGLVCRRIGARCKEVQPDRAVYQFPGLLLRYRNDLHWGRFDQAMERMETMAALALSVVLRECKQMGTALTTEQGVRFLESHILPHQNRGILKNRADEIAMQFQSVLAKNNCQGIRTQAEKKEVASAWLELAISCAKVPVKYEADEIKRRQKEEKTQREAEPVMA